MFKSRLLKAALLGLCLSAFVSNTAFAKMVAPVQSTAPAIGAPADGQTIAPDQNASSTGSAVSVVGTAEPGKVANAGGGYAESGTATGTGAVSTDPDTGNTTGADVKPGLGIATGIDGSPVAMPYGAESLGAPDVAHAEDDVLMSANSDGSQPPVEAKALAASNGLTSLSGDADKKSDAVSTPIIILAITGGIIIVGGVGFAYSRKRTKK